MEQALSAAIADAGYEVVRAHPFKADQGHGFIQSQKEGMEVFRTGVDPDVPLIVAEAVWQYSHHILHGLLTHRAPICTVANWSGQWPGLVGMLNLNGSLTKAGGKYSTLWGEDFSAAGFAENLTTFLKNGKVKHKLAHVTPLKKVKLPGKAHKLGAALADALRREKAIMGVFDEGCMGMFNAIIPDHLLNPCGVFKERLSQSGLYYASQQVSDEEAREVLNWYLAHGMQFQFGTNDETDLTENQVLQQCKMYIAAMRIADEFGCATIGIQYQQGLKDLAPASDLVEGLLNNVDRPPVRAADSNRVLFQSDALPHFNEVD